MKDAQLVNVNVIVIVILIVNVNAHLGLAAHELSKLALEVVVGLGQRHPQHARRGRLVLILLPAAAARRASLQRRLLGRPPPRHACAAGNAAIRSVLAWGGSEGVSPCKPEALRTCEIMASAQCSRLKNDNAVCSKARSAY